MTEIKTRADLFEAAAKMMRMCDEAVVEHAFKWRGTLHRASPNFTGPISDYEFPLAIVEGKPVFHGDELYCTSPDCYQCNKNGTSKFIVGDEKSGGLNPDFTRTSWNPPKPKTVMVELEVADARTFVGLFENVSTQDYFSSRIAQACRKALEEEK